MNQRLDLDVSNIFDGASNVILVQQAFTCRIDLGHSTMP